jgi:hypothetical protein
VSKHKYYHVYLGVWLLDRIWDWMIGFIALIHLTCYYK